MEECEAPRTAESAGECQPYYLKIGGADEKGADSIQIDWYLGAQMLQSSCGISSSIRIPTGPGSRL